MSLSAKLRRAPLRAVTGAFIVNSGVGKLSADAETAQQLHGMASGTYGFLGKIDPKLFVKGLAAGEIALGSAVLLPIVSPVVAGLGLAGFSGAMLNMYWNTPGLHADGDPRPTPAGLPIAKDIWMFGIGTGLVVDGLVSPAHDKKVQISATVHEKRNRKERRKAKKAAKKTRAEAREHALEIARDRQAELGKRASKALSTAQTSDAAKKARKASEDAAKRIAGAREEYAPVVAEKAKQARGTAVDLYDQYAPVVAEKAKTARDAAADLVDEYAPVVADRARTGAKDARDTAADLYGQYAPVVADRARTGAKTARDTAANWYDDASSAADKKVTQSRRTMRRNAKQATKQARKISH